MDERTKEIRRILRGLMTYENDGAVIMAAPNLLHVQSEGILRGSDNAGIAGVSVTMRQYLIPNKLQATQMDCVMAMLELGQQVLLRSSSDTLAVLHRPLFLNPAIITLDAEANQLLLCVYTSRSLFAKLNVKRILKTWEETMPDSLRETSVTMTPPGAVETEKEKRRPEKKKDNDKKTGGKNDTASGKKTDSGTEKDSEKKKD